MYEEDFKPHDSVGAVIKNADNEILVLFHNKYKLWTIPVGKVFEDEIHQYALLREMKEELNIDLNENDISFMHTNPIEYQLEGKTIETKGYIYEVERLVDPINNEPTKHSMMTYMSLGQLEELLKNKKLTNMTISYLESLKK